MYKPSDVEDYIDHHENWKEELNALRSVMLESDLEETIKWYIPTYTLKNKNVIGMGAFKEWVALWFFQGVFLDDPLEVLVNAQEDVTKGLRQWRFRKGDDIPHDALLAYVIEATENQKKGLEIKVKKKKFDPSSVPNILSSEIRKSQEIGDMWEKLTDATKVEYVKYIESAKQEATKQRRIQKILPLILSGKGLHDQYKK